MYVEGAPPPAPPWGQRLVYEAPELRRRIAPDPGLSDEVAVVLGAGGAFGPDVVRGLLYAGARAVVGADVQLTYPVPEAIYRRVDLADRGGVSDLLARVRAGARAVGARLGTVYDLSTIQTTPRGASDRAALERGKRGLVDALRESEGDARLFFMSTAEVYGAPPGAPYAEDHEKRPFNAYGRAKLREETDVMAGHDAPTRGGRLRVVALRSWTICMVEQEGDAIVEARNYNDPQIAIAERLARVGARVPVVDPALLATFHFSEEVAEVAVRLGSAPPDAPTFGRAFNMVGRPATHGALRDALAEVFRGNRSNEAWGFLARPLLASGRLPRRALERTGASLERLGALGARDLGARLPFLYRSTHLDTRALEDALGDRLAVPGGSDSIEAARRMAIGIREGGPHSLAQRRFRLY